jgi:hypothetical protein
LRQRDEGEERDKEYEEFSLRGQRDKGVKRDKEFERKFIHIGVEDVIDEIFLVNAKCAKN